MKTHLELNSLNRRGFLGGCLKSSLLMALGGAWNQRGTAAVFSARSREQRPYALKPLGPLGNRPGSPPPEAGGITSWRYDWKFYHIGPSPETARIDDLGSVEIRRTASAGKVEYAVDQQREFGHYEAVLTCLDEPGEPLIQWEARQRQQGLTSEVEGLVSGSTAHIVRGGVMEEMALSGPLHSDLSLLVRPSNLGALHNRTFCLLEGSAMVRPDVRVRRDPATDTEVDGVSTTAWLFTGTGLLPMHTLVDEAGRALCRTAFTTSLVLNQVNL